MCAAAAAFPCAASAINIIRLNEHYFTPLLFDSGTTVTWISCTKRPDESTDNAFFLFSNCSVNNMGRFWP